MNKKVITLVALSVLATASTVKAEASTFTNLTGSQLDKVEQQIDTKKDKLDELHSDKIQTSTLITNLTVESDKIDKAKAAAQAEKDKVAKEIEAVKAQIKAKQDQKAAEEQKQKELDAQKAAEAEKLTAVSQPTPSAPVASSNGIKVVAGGLSAEQRTYVLSKMQAATGVPASQWDAIISRESGWNPTVVNSLGYYGLFQLAPGYKGNGGNVDEQIAGAIFLFQHGGMAHWAL